MVAKCGLFTEDSEIISDCLWSISHLADTNDDNIIGMIASGETLPIIIQAMSSKDFSVFVPGLRAMGNILTTNDTDVIERCIFNGVLTPITNIMYSSNANLIKECCWALSNITAGPASHIEAFLDSPAFNRTLDLTKSFSIDHRKEAIWVLVNSITGSDVVIR